MKEPEEFTHLTLSSRVLRGAQSTDWYSVVDTDIYERKLTFESILETWRVETGLFGLK